MKPSWTIIPKLPAILVIIVWGSAVYAASQPVGPTATEITIAHVNEYENQLITSLRDIQEQRVDGALKKIGNLVEKNPRFKLAQLIYADLLLAKAGPIRDFGNAFTTTPSEELAGLKSEAQVRWQHHSTHPDAGYIPSNLLRLAPKTRHAVAVDLTNSRLFLFKHRQGEYQLLGDYYVSIGKNGAVKQVEGDKKTPVGVYHITGFLPPEQLPDFYGVGAFPLNYPNALDKAQGKTGYGIWLHGTPTDTYSRRPRASDGCITLSNSDLDAIKPLLMDEAVPVVIAEKLDWIKQENAITQGEYFNEVLNAWRRDWQSLDHERYLSHYSLDFRSKRMDYAVWAQHKKRVNGNKDFIAVDLDQVEIFDYPGNKALRVVTFTQKYHSNNYNEVSRKRQYWRLEEDGAWRIIYEGPA